MTWFLTVTAAGWRKIDLLLKHFRSNLPDGGESEECAK